MRLSRLVVLMLSVAVLMAVLIPLRVLASAPTSREFNLTAGLFEWRPNIIRVNQGDRVTLKLTSLDVVHGFYLDAYDINVYMLPGKTATVEFVADKIGKFRFRCSYTCGNLHPFLIGELIVEPNSPFDGSVVLTVLAALGTLAYIWTRKETSSAAKGPVLSHVEGNPGSAAAAVTLPRVRPWGGILPALHRLDLMQIPVVRTVLRHRAFQYLVILPNLFFFVIVILTGLFGTPIGNHNFAIIFVWIVWWALLIIVLIPFGARVWCTMCPIPAPGEWLQRLAFIARPKRRPFTLDKEWPVPLRNIWLQNISFLSVAIFSAIILTTPIATGSVLLLFILLAVALSLVYRRRIFCRYLCPVGGFIGLYSMVAPVELRVKDPKVCNRHCGKECIRGSEAGYGCPWLEYPGTLNRNAYCGLCTECLKTCPLDNIAINVRPFGTDLLVPKRHLDEAYKAFIMLTSAIIYSVVMLGPWAWIKDWANLTSLPTFLAYAAGLLTVNLLVVPGLFLAFAWLSKLLSGDRSVTLKQLFVAYAYALVPMGLMGWIAFSLSFLFVNVSYAIPLISDPFGWGWNLLGTKYYPWTPYFPGLVPYLQVPVLVAGLVLSILLAFKISQQNFTRLDQARRAVVPIAAFLTGVTLVFVRLYLG